MIMIVGAVVVLLIVLLSIAVTRPDTFRVERSASIKAPPEAIYPLIEDLHRWTAWSPWEKLDPQLNRSYSGAASGVGAAYTWEGNRKVGQGQMQIVEATPPTLVRIDLHVLRPFEARNTAEFTLRPTGEETEVTWAIYGPNTLMGKLMSVFVSMDRMMGGDFERGLADLKARAEESHGAET